MKVTCIPVVFLLLFSVAAGCGEGESKDGADSGVSSDDAGDGLNDADDDAGQAEDDTSSGLSPLVTIESSTYATSHYYNPGLEHELYTGIIILSEQAGTCEDAATACDGQHEERALVIELSAGREYSDGVYTVNDVSDSENPEEFTADSKSASASLVEPNGDEPWMFGSVTITRYDAQGIEGAYNLDIDGTNYIDRFEVDACAGFEAPTFGCQ